MHRLDRENLLTGAIRRLVRQVTDCPRAAIRQLTEPPLQLRSVRLLAGVVLLTLWAPTPALAWGGQVRLTRRYQSGQKMVYATKMNTKSVIHSEPPELQNFLPPLPANFTVQQQNTVTVKAVHNDGSADIENHFDKFEFQSDLADRVPANFRDSAVRAQQDVSEHVAGQDIVAHFDRNGRLVGFEGGEGLFEQLDLTYREPLRQALRFFLEQVGGDTLYPEHPVKPGETWKRKLDSPPSAAYPYNVEGENTMRYVGKTKVGGVRAAVVEFSFVNVLRPAPDALGKAEPLAQLESHGLGVDMRIDGQGKGRVLLALDDGRVLQNHATIHQTLTARLEGSAPLPFKKSQTLKLEVRSDSEMDVEGTGR
jgi:hypothetical protein